MYVTLVPSDCPRLILPILCIVQGMVLSTYLSGPQVVILTDFLPFTYQGNKTEEINQKEINTEQAGLPCNPPEASDKIRRLLYSFSQIDYYPPTRILPHLFNYLHPCPNATSVLLLPAPASKRNPHTDISYIPSDRADSRRPY